MKETKDNFSEQAQQYAVFRPHYPEALFSFLYHHVAGFDHAWDCGTGNGQVAVRLAEKFGQVWATDISEKQLQQAPRLANVTYAMARAEQTTLPDSSLDLITLAQALHWFDLEAFYGEVRRVAKPQALLAVWGYNLLRITPEIDAPIHDFYHRTVGPYWDAERKLVDTAYQSIPFPFAEIPGPDLNILVHWDLAQLLGYLSSWSSVRHYRAAQDRDPVAELAPRLEAIWPAGVTQAVHFPLFIRAGHVAP